MFNLKPSDVRTGALTQALPSRAPENSPTRQQPTISTIPERVLIFLFAAWVPLDPRYPLFGIASYGALLIGLLGAVLLVRRPQAIARTAVSARMLPAYGFMVAATLTEFIQPTPSLVWIARLAQMIAGIILFAAACRDKPAVGAALWGVMVGGAAMAALFILSSWSTFSALTTIDFVATSAAVDESLNGTVLGGGSYNLAATYAAAAGGVAVAMAVQAARSRRVPFIAVAILSFVGAALSASRGAVFESVVATVTGLLIVGRGRMKRVLVGVALAVMVVAIIPTSAFGRILTSKEESTGGKLDPRTVLWEAVGQNLDAALPIGVGNGNFATEWGAKHGFVVHLDNSTVSGTHSSVTQVLVFWGIVPVAMLVWFFASLLTKLFRSCTRAPLNLPSLVLLITLTAELFFSDELQSKMYVVGCGLAVALLTWRPYESDASQGLPDSAEAAGPAETIT